MSFSLENLGLYTDFYELSMAQGYFCAGKQNNQVTFDYYFRTNPFKGGFTVFAGLYDFLEFLHKFTFSESDLTYLKTLGFQDEFLEYLKTFSFKGEIESMTEGEVVFPNEPLIKITGNIIEAQLIESLLLNILNFESLIATKALRIYLASGKNIFSDFGLRRAQGFGAIHASRAACIGGAKFTSNVLAGKIYDIPVGGTQAHSWIQSFDSELAAFEAYANAHPNNSILLVDTYDTLKSGIPNAIKIAQQLELKGLTLKGIRLDSGDLAYLSKKARKMLDNAGLQYVKIVASNQLNEYVIKSLIKDQNAPIDSFGVGTELITGKPDASLDGVYKLSWIDGIPKMKISENIEKVTLPGQKTVYRYFDEDGNFFKDGILLNTDDPQNIETLFHPVYPEKKSTVKSLKKEALLKKVYSEEKILIEKKNPLEIFAYLKRRLERLPDEHKRFISPHIYKVGVSETLLKIKLDLIERLKK